MTAEIIVLSDYRPRRARVRYAVTFDPLAMMWAWFAFWFGGR